MKLYLTLNSDGNIVCIDTNRKSAQSFLDKYPGQYSIKVFEKVPGTSVFLVERP